MLLHEYVIIILIRSGLILVLVLAGKISFVLHIGSIDKKWHQFTSNTYIVILFVYYTYIDIKNASSFDLFLSTEDGKISYRGNNILNVDT